MGERAVASGLPMVGELDWGAHLCQLYGDRRDLVDTLVAYHRQGLRDDERCLWVAAAPLPAADARAALLAAVPELPRYEAAGQIEIVDVDAWRAAGGDAAGRWVEREAEALRRGFRGLRVSGHWRHDEADLGEACRGRRIVALCSYARPPAGDEAIVDALRGHELLLVRNGGIWDLIRRAGAEHVVELYDRAFPAATVARFLADGVDAGEAAVAIATPAHTEALVAALAAAGVDVARAAAAGQLVLLDAQATLDQLLVDGRPDGAEMRRRLGARLGELAARFGGVSAFGEMVDLLTTARRPDDAVALERLWNQLLAELPVRLLCAYDLAAFDDDGDSSTLRRVCDVHAHLHGLAEAPPPRRDHVIAELKQKTRLVRVAAEQLALLQRVTALLSEAACADDVARVVVRDVAAIVGADEAFLALAEGDGATLEVVGRVAGDDAPLRRLGRFSVGNQCALAAAFQSGAPLWLETRDEIVRRFATPHGAAHALVCLPLTVGSRRVGALAFGYVRERDLLAAERRLFEDLTRQVAVALDRARLFDETERARAQAEEASRAKDEFLAVLGHELRNPLSPIVTALHLMRLRGDDLLVKERTVIERQVQHMGRLVDDLLDISRVTRGKVELKRRPIELSEAIALAIEQASPALEARAHRLQVSAPTTGLLVEADPTRLAQAIANLLTNAAKYSDGAGEVVLSAWRAGNEVLVRVRDDGVGIEPALLPRVFDLFVQGRQSSDRGQGGLGLGLALVRSFVELHGGTVSARSDGPGRGSEFTIRLPALSEAARVEAPVDAPRIGRVGLARRVLVVDDNVDAAELLAEMLRSAGHEVAVAYDGPGALEAMAQRCPDVAILDIGLPVMDGYELAARVRERFGAGRPRLVALTGYGQDHDRRRSLRAGFVEHLVKPVDPARVFRVVAACDEERAPGDVTSSSAS